MFRLLISIFGLVLKKELAPAEARKTVRLARRRYPELFALARQNYRPENTDLKGWFLYRNGVAVASIYHAARELYGEKIAARATYAVIKFQGDVGARFAMPPIPARVDKPFEWFKRRLDKANTSLSLWKWTASEESASIYRTDFFECGFWEIARALDLRELGPLFCAWDDDFLPKYDLRLEFIRTKTLARGDELCDFCYRWRD